MSIRRILQSLIFVHLLASFAVQARYTFVLPPANAANPQVLMFNDQLQRLSAVNVPGDAFQVLINPAGTKAMILTRSAGTPVLFVNIANNQFSGPTRPLQLDGNTPLVAQVAPNGEQLIVLAAGGTGLIYKIDIGAEQISGNGRIGTSTGAVDFCLSYDSRYAFVVSANNFLVVDLVNATILQNTPLEARGFSVSISLRGSVYVGQQGALVEYSAFAPFARRGSIPLQYGPGKLSFSPDGKYGIAPNALQNAASILSFDLETRGITAPSGIFLNAVSTPINGQLQIPDSIQILNDTRALAFYGAAGQVLEISIPNLAVNQFFIGGTPLGSADGLVVSEEYPAARSVYYSTAGSLGKLEIPGNIVFPNAFSQRGALNYGVVVTPGRAPGNIYAFNGGQVVEINQQLRPVTFKVTEGGGRPVGNARIALTASVPGVVLNPESLITNQDGIAAVGVTAPSTVGTFTIRAQAQDGSGGPVTTIETTVVGTGGGGGGGGGGTGGMIRWAGDGQVMQIGVFSDPITVRLTNAQGQPIANRPVTFVGESGAFAYSPDFLQQGVVVINTDANGLASAIFGGNPQPTPGPRDFREIRVNVSSEAGVLSFVGLIHGIPDGPYDNRPVILMLPTQGGEIRAKLGQKIDNAVRSVTQNRLSGAPLANVGIRAFTEFGTGGAGPAASCEGQNPLSGIDGVSVCNLIVSGRTGNATLTVDVGANPIEGTPSRTSGARVFYRLVVEAGDPEVIVKSAGDNQRGLPGATLPTPLEVTVQDGFGNALVGIPVNWQLVTPGSLILTNIVSTSDTSGKASARVTLGPNPGTYLVRVTAGSKTAEFSVNIDANIGGVVKVGGDNQTAVVGQPFAQPLVVEVRDTQNRPISNLRVTWVVTAGAVGLNSTTSNTGTDGRALVNVVAGAIAGSATVTATVTGQQPVSFGLTVRLPGPSITSASFANLASGEQVLTPGGLVIIRGQGLAPGIVGTLNADLLKGQLPTTINDSTVQFTWAGGQALAPIYSVSNANNQESIVVQVPFELAGTLASATVSVKGGNTAVQNIPVRPYSPGILEDFIGGSRMAILIRPDGSRVSPTNPARRGETIRAYLIGLGQTTPAAFTNRVGFPDQKVQAVLTVGINYSAATFRSAYMAMNLVGVYEVVFDIPQDAPTGSSIPLTLSADDQVTGTRYFSNDSFIPIG